MTTKPLTNIPVRFFIYNEDAVHPFCDYDGNVVECDEQTFLEADGEIKYERHTVHSNGVSQICLTKLPNY